MFSLLFDVGLWIVLGALNVQILDWLLASAKLIPEFHQIREILDTSFLTFFLVRISKKFNIELNNIGLTPNLPDDIGVIYTFLKNLALNIKIFKKNK